MSAVIARLLIGAVFLSLVTSCSQVPTPSGDAVDLSTLKRERLSLEKEWRNGVRLSGSGPRMLNLGAVSADTYLRLGVRGADQLEGRVYLGDRVVYEFAQGAEDDWTEHRVDFSRSSDSSCKVVLDSPGEVWLSVCELVTPQVSKPNLLIVLVDTLRQDFLHCYYYPLDTSPNLDAFAEDAVTFWELLPSAAWTRPSVASLMTAVPPNVHKVHDEFDAIAKGLGSLYGALASESYSTQGFITNPNCLPHFGFGDEFSRYLFVDDVGMAAGWENDAHTVDEAVEAIEHLAGEPWAFYVHLLGPHRPYSAPKDLVAKFQPSHFIGTRRQQRVQRDMVKYAAEIAQVDIQFGRLVESLKRTGQYEDTMVVFLSDHGEQFMEHGLEGHAHTLFEEELKVPLIIKIPGKGPQGESRKSLVEMSDIAPTILDVLEVAQPDSFLGESFAEHISRNEYSPRMTAANLHFRDNRFVMARNGVVKYIRDVVRQEDSWYDLLEDKGERQPLRSSPPEGGGLKAYAIEAAVKHAPGLHVVITCPVGEAAEFSGRLEGEWSYYPTLSSEPDSGDVLVDDDGVGFRIHFEAGDSLVDDELRVARIHFEVPSDGAVQLTVLRDGERLDPARIVTGTSLEGIALAGEAVAMADIIGTEMKSLPERAAVYVWYVEPTTLDQGVDGEMHEDLRALGYLE